MDASLANAANPNVQQMRDKSAGSDAPEAVKPGTTALTTLKAPDPSRVLGFPGLARVSGGFDGRLV